MTELEYDSSNLVFALSCAVDALVLLAALGWALRGERVAAASPWRWRRWEACWR